jgi:hypothetical protein
VPLESLADIAKIAKKTAAACAAIALAVSPLAVTGACSSSAATTTFIPQTGIVVRAETLTSGVGCGTAATQIWKYVAVAVNDADGTAIAGSAYDCFADAVLVNLPASLDGGGATFTVHVYAYDLTAFDAASATISTALARIPDVSTKVLPDLATSAPTYTTTCTVTEFANIQAVASCETLTSAK